MIINFGNIDRESGEILIQKVLDIVEKVEDPAREISLDHAKKLEKNDQKTKLAKNI